MTFNMCTYEILIFVRVFMGAYVYTYILLYIFRQPVYYCVYCALFTLFHMSLTQCPSIANYVRNKRWCVDV